MYKNTSCGDSFHRRCFIIKKYIGIAVAGICAGAVNGLFGAGGGMVLVPLLTWLSDLNENEIFPASVSIILPICFVSLGLTFSSKAMDWNLALPYLAGSVGGGILAGFLGKKIPTLWLHRFLGVLILWGGMRYLC